MANRNLPQLNPMKARSSIALALTLGALVAPNLLGEIDAEQAGQAASGAAEAINTLIGVAAAVWFWLERRAPNYRLSFGRGRG